MEESLALRTQHCSQRSRPSMSSEPLSRFEFEILMLERGPPALPERRPHEHVQASPDMARQAPDRTSNRCKLASRIQLNCCSALDHPERKTCSRVSCSFKPILGVPAGLPLSLAAGEWTLLQSNNNITTPLKQATISNSQPSYKRKGDFLKSKQ
mmetsp:Transcript_25452/g.59237  ORF Transcript_25452/g.59237 Transcript_25452/m.59237 type:complete len:154 (+) Transcript_25452:587-1048(+)